MRPAAAAKLENFYKAFLDDPQSQLLAKTNLPASHGIATDKVGSECGVSDHRLYIENCGYDR